MLKLFARKPEMFVDRLLTFTRVQDSGGLVGHQHLGMQDQPPHDLDLTLLSVRQFLHFGMRVATQAQAFWQLYGGSLLS